MTLKYEPQIIYVENHSDDNEYAKEVLKGNSISKEVKATKRSPKKTKSTPEENN